MCKDNKKKAFNILK